MNIFCLIIHRSQDVELPSSIICIIKDAISSLRGHCIRAISVPTSCGDEFYSRLSRVRPVRVLSLVLSEDWGR